MIIKCLLLVLFALASHHCMLAQDSPSSIDSTINKVGRKRSKLGNIVVGPHANRMLFFYFKTTRKIFSIIYQQRYPIGGKVMDSTTSYGFFFRNDKLVAISLRVFPLRKDRPDTRLHFQDDRLIAQKGPRFFSEEEVNALIGKAYGYFADGNERIRQKFINR